MTERFHPIGTPGQPWNDDDRAAWLRSQKVRRSYRDEVLDKLERLPGSFDIEPYGALGIDRDRYPLFAVTCPLVEPGPPVGL